MSLLAAATLGDDIVHTPLMAQILKVATTIGTGLLTGIAIGAAAAFIVGTGGLGAVVLGAVVGAVIGLAADKIAQHALGAESLDDAITRPIMDAIDKAIPGSVEGKIVTGSPNVFINSIAAARAAGKPDPGFPARQAAGLASEDDTGFIAVDQDKVACQKHPPMPEQFLAQGSSNVFINGMPGVRIGDKTTCDGKVSLNPAHAAARNVSIGGQTVSVRHINSEMPPWLDRVSRYAGMAIGLCQAIRGKGPLLGKLACFGINMAVSMAADAAVRGTSSYLSGLFGHPVHIPTGAKVLGGSDDTDFVLPDRLPLEWVRSYNSSNTRTGLFGRGWITLYELELHLNAPDPSDPNAQHYLIDLQGRRVPLQHLERGQKCRLAQEGITFARTMGGHYLVRFDDGITLEFTPWVEPETGEGDDAAPAALRPWLIEDRNGNLHYLHYSGTSASTTGRLEAIASEAGLHVVFDYDTTHPGRVAAIRQLGSGVDSPGSPQRTLVRYRYDTHGQLSEVCGEDGAVLRRFEWNDSLLMTAQHFASGLAVHYRWHAEPGHAARVVHYDTSAGESVGIEYRLDSSGAGSASATDQLGRVWHWHWDALRRITTYEDPLGARFLLEWDPEARYLQRITNPLGGVTTLDYDENGNIAQETDPLGRTRSTVWHRELPEALAHTTFGGTRWEWQYDIKVNATSESANGVIQQRWERDRHGLVIARTDARGGVQHFSYDRHGNLLQETDCSDRSTRYAYDRWDRLITVTDAAGQATTYTYNSASEVTSISLPDGSQRQLGWYPNGTLQTDSYEGALTRYQYDAQGRLDASTDPVGKTVRQRYDSASRMTELIDGGNQTTRFEYDAADQLTVQIAIDGLRTEYRHDPCGRPIAVIQSADTPDALLTKLERDAAGRLVCKKTPETLTRYDYDDSDQLTHIARWLVSHPQETADPLLLDEITFGYNGQGQPVSETSTIHALQHHEFGLPLAWRKLNTPRITTIEREFDELGNPLRTVLPSGQAIDCLYYGSGHVHQLRFGGETVSDIERDLLHRETSRSQGSLKTSYTLDPLGRLLGATAKTQGTPLHPSALRIRALSRGDIIDKRFTWNRQGHLAQRTDLLGERHAVHDAAGRILETRDSTSEPERFSWDAADNCTPIQTSAAGRIENNRVRVWQDIRFNYDAHGRLVRKDAGSRATTLLRWNNEHQLVTSNTERFGVSTQFCLYHYDSLGRRTGKTDRFGTTWFVWDGMRMVQEQRGGQCISTVYTDPNSYEPLARIEHGEKEQTITPDQIFYFHTDANGAPEELTSSALGQVVWRARYKTWGNTVSETWDEEYEKLNHERRRQNLRYQGQYFDEESGLHYNTFRYYDPDIGRFISQDPIGLAGGMNLYQYAPSAAEWVDPWGLSCSQLDKDRRSGVAKAWRQERRLVKLTGQGTRRWTRSEKVELLSKGKVTGYEGHHINSAEKFPHLANQPDNIKFVKGRTEHLAEHQGNFQNPTQGPFLDRSTRLQQAKLDAKAK